MMIALFQDFHLKFSFYHEKKRKKKKAQDFFADNILNLK